MAYTSSELALQEGLLKYFQSLLYESISTPPLPYIEEISTDIGVIIHFPIKSIMDEAKKISAYRGKYTVNQQGEPDTGIILTTDEDSLMDGILKTWAVKVFDELSHASKKLRLGYKLEDNVTPVEYTNQIEFLEGDLYTVSGVLYRCLADTNEPPSGDSEYWMLIEDGDPKRVYYFLLLPENWDINTSDLLEKSIFNALHSAILKEWYRITGRVDFYGEFTSLYEGYIMDARSATYRRVNGITLKQSFP